MVAVGSSLRGFGVDERRAAVVGSASGDVSAIVVVKTAVVGGTAVDLVTVEG